jgi:hypothetical protein
MKFLNVSVPRVAAHVAAAPIQKLPFPWLLLPWLLLPVDVLWLLHLWLLPHYVEAVLDFPLLKELQAFLGLLNFYQRSYPASQRCCAPPG